MHNFSYPPNLFWDENYHIASAQKYLHNVYYMEPHPPLGKLMIAAGEALFRPNEASDQFIGTDYGRKIPDGFSFMGYRFFPTFFAWMIAPLLYGCFLLITKNRLFSALLSFLYIFDNALIVHQRAAMLESTLLFFMVVMIYLWIHAMQSKKTDSNTFKWLCIGMGAALGAVVTTKVNGLIMVLLVPPLLLKLWPNWKQIGKTIGFGAFGFFTIFIGVWHIHFTLGSTVNDSLPDQGYYQASEQYKKILADGKTGSLFNFPIMIRDSMHFLPHYQKGVPKLDLCKANENGSPFFYWPFGGRSINYRWETPGGSSAYQYLYLQSNPVVWLFGLLGVILATCLLAAHVFLPLKHKVQQPMFLAVFLGIYVSYMLTMSQISRVMYLYHYFIPLIISFFLFGLSILEIQQFFKWKIKEHIQTYILLTCSLLIFAGYQFYRPLSYYEPITDKAFQRRDIMKVWDLKCVRCDKERYLHPKTCS